VTHYQDQGKEGDGHGGHVKHSHLSVRGAETRAIGANRDVSHTHKVAAVRQATLFVHVVGTLKRVRVGLWSVMSSACARSQPSWWHWRSLRS
jgi:hypothetical protein